MSNMRMGACAILLVFSLWSQDGCCSSRHSDYVQSRTDEEVSQMCPSYHPEKSFPETPRRHPLTSHWPEPGNIPTYKPTAVRREWFRPTTIDPLGLGVEPLSTEHIAICSMLEQRGSSLSQKEGRDFRMHQTHWATKAWPEVSLGGRGCYLLLPWQAWPSRWGWHGLCPAAPRMWSSKPPGFR